MAEDAPYIVYVTKSDGNESTELENDIPSDAEVYADEEYLDFSQDEHDSDGPAELLDVDMQEEPGPSITIKPNESHPSSNRQSAIFTWTHPATLNLIEAYQSFETSLVSGELSISQVWEQVSGHLHSQGFQVTPQHCKNKFGSLKQIYEKNKEQEIKSGVSVKKWIYMDLMEPIMMEMEKYRSYSNDAWDSRKCLDVNQLDITKDQDKKNCDVKQLAQNIYKWENPAILSLIDLYRKYQGALDSGSISQKVLFRLVEKDMQNKGFNVTATQCMVKFHSLKKTYKSIKEYNQVNRVIPRRWRYYDLIDCIIHGPSDTSSFDPLEEVSKTLAEIKSEEPTPSNIFKWSRRSIEILVSAYREHRPPLHDTKATRQKVWEMVVQKLRKGGYSVSVAQCRSKISGMLKLYRKNKSGEGGRAWSVRGGWYSKLIESLVEKPKTMPKVGPKKLSELQGRKPESVLEQLIICEENRERRHRESMEQKQQLLDLMGRLLDRLTYAD